MKFLSYALDGNHSWGALHGNKIIDLREVTGHHSLGSALRAFDIKSIESLARQNEPSVSIAQITYLPVITDNTKIFCIGLNYEEHRVEALREKTANPTVFVRFASSQTGHEQPIVLPPESSQMDYEGEIAVVIGRPGRRIAEADAWSHIAGYAPYNDASVRDWQAQTTQWTPGKNFPSTGAFGPFMCSRSEVADDQELTVATRLNGQEMQRATTAQLIFTIPRLLAYCSTFTRLEPGDVIVTGTPGGVGFKRIPPVFLKEGDIVEVEIQGMPILRNPVVREASS